MADCECGKPAVWKMNPEFSTPDLVEAMADDSLDMDPMKIVEACAPTPHRHASARHARTS